MNAHDSKAPKCMKHVPREVVRKLREVQTKPHYIWKPPCSSLIINKTSSLHHFNAKLYHTFKEEAISAIHNSYRK
jgi:hypothetical protein